MKRKDFLKSIKDKAKTDLVKMAADNLSKTRSLLMDKSMGKIKNNKAIKDAKKSRARILTKLNSNL